MLLTLGAHAQRGLGSCVCLSVCLSVQHVTSRAYFRPENHITYSTGNEGENNCVHFSETAPLQLPALYGYPYSPPFWKPRMRITAFSTRGVDRSDHVFLCVLGRHSEYCELPLDMPPSKVCPECDAVVPIQLKVCKSCQRVSKLSANRS